jgi:uncharacterized cupredoxin-like copper-binding protein
VTFSIKNAGATMHQFAIMHAPAELVKGAPVAADAIATGKMLAAGQTETVHANLPAGRYELVCLMAGHDAAGQTLDLRVR